MSLIPTLRDLSTTLSDAWYVATDAFTAADLLPLATVWGLGLATAEGQARLDVPPTAPHSLVQH